MASRSRMRTASANRTAFARAAPWPSPATTGTARRGTWCSPAPEGRPAHRHHSPLCDRPLTTNDATDTTLRTQVRAAAYPTRRPLRVAKGLGNQAIVGSICPTNAW